MSDPWGGGHDCWKGGGKIFALSGAMEDRVTVKCDGIETASMLIDAGVAQKAPYMHRSWVALDCGAAREVLARRIRLYPGCMLETCLPLVPLAISE